MSWSATKTSSNFQNMGLNTLNGSSIVSEARNEAGQRSKSCLLNMLEIAEIVKLRELLIFLLSWFPMGHRSHRSFILQSWKMVNRGRPMLSLTWSSTPKPKDRDDVEKNKQGTGPRELSGEINQIWGSGSVGPYHPTTTWKLVSHCLFDINTISTCRK